MSGARTTRTTAEKIALFRGAFSGRLDAYGTYDLRTGKVFQVKQPVTDQVILRHLKGVQPYGFYPLVGERTRVLAADFDDPDMNGPMDFLAAAKNRGLHAYIEISKSKGHHVWTFFEEDGVLAAKARTVAREILTETGCPNVEVFPKHDRLDGMTRFGNFIFAPLFGRLVPKGRTAFVDEANPGKPYPDQWELLANIQRVTELHLDELFESCLDERPGEQPGPAAWAPTDIDPERTFGLMPCAQRMLLSGVRVDQRSACFWLAVQLRKTGQPQDLVLVSLRAWARKNRPVNGKGIITDAEIASQVRSAYAHRYRGCGCDDPAVMAFCSPECVLRTRRGRSNGAAHSSPVAVNPAPSHSGANDPPSAHGPTAGPPASTARNDAEVRAHETQP